MHKKHTQNMYSNKTMTSLYDSRKCLKVKKNNIWCTPVHVSSVISAKTLIKEIFYRVSLAFSRR